MTTRDPVMDDGDFVPRRPIGHRWAVIVGISKHKHKKIGDLRYAHRDAEDLYALLQKPSGGGFDRRRILPLINEAATTEALNRALRTFLKKPAKDDLVVLYFAGHGFVDPDPPNVVYFVTHDADPDDIAGTSVPMSAIEAALRTLRADRVVILADTCHSAAITMDSGLRAPGRDAQVINKDLDKLSTAKAGVALLTSATASESAREGAEWRDGADDASDGHGVFTYFVLEGLRGAADGYKSRRDFKVSIGELFDYVRDKVQEATRDAQHPTQGSQDFDRGLIMAYTGGENATDHHDAGTGLLRLAQLGRDAAAYAAAARHFAEAIGMARAMAGEYPEAELAPPSQVQWPWMARDARGPTVNVRDVRAI